MNKKIYIKSHIEKADKDTYKFLASTSSIDRQGDSVDQSGWDLKNFMSNPVMLWAHNYNELPVGKVVNIEITARGLEAEMVFAEMDANPKAQQIKKLVDSGILNAVSVGFIAKRRDGNIITESELLEISIVPVPANQDAIRLAVKSLDVGEVIKNEILEDLDNEPKDEDETEEEPKEDEIIEEEDEEDEEEPEVETKSGRVISKKTRKALEITRDNLLASVSEIDKLLSMEATTTDELDEDEKSIVIPKDVVEDLKYHLRSENKKNENLLKALKLLN